MSACPLCGRAETEALPSVRGRRYRACPRCHLAFMLPVHHLDAAAERRVYEQHRNDPADPQYRAFLDRLARPLADRLAPGARGLDYGAGPGPALAAMLGERGHPTDVYDPIYAPDAGLLARRYDFVTCTEAAEHFRHPGAEFERLHQLLRPGGWLGLMTQWRLPGRDFAAWRYVHDPTHVCFYGPGTLAWIARQHGWRLHCPAPHVALFQRG